MTDRISTDKLEKARNRLWEAQAAQKLSRLALQRLLGTLMPAGRTFLFRLLAHLRSPEAEKRRPTPERAREDIQIWLQYLDTWNAEYSIKREQDINWEDWGICTEASDWGMGGYCLRLKEWFSIP